MKTTAALRKFTFQTACADARGLRLSAGKPHLRMKMISLPFLRCKHQTARQLAQAVWLEIIFAACRRAWQKPCSAAGYGLHRFGALFGFGMVGIESALGGLENAVPSAVLHECSLCGLPAG